MITGQWTSSRGQPESGSNGHVGLGSSSEHAHAVEELLDDDHSHTFSRRHGDDRPGFKLTVRFLGQRAFPNSLSVPDESQLALLNKFSLAIAPARRASLVLNFSDPDLRPKRLVFDNYDSKEFMKARVYFDQDSRLVGYIEKDLNIRKNDEMNPWFHTFRPVQILDKNDDDVYLSGTADVGFQRRLPPEDLVWP